MPEDPEAESGSYQTDDRRDRGREWGEARETGRRLGARDEPREPPAPATRLDEEEGTGTESVYPGSAGGERMTGATRAKLSEAERRHAGSIRAGREAANRGGMRREGDARQERTRGVPSEERDESKGSD